MSKEGTFDLFGKAGEKKAPWHVLSTTSGGDPLALERLHAACGVKLEDEKAEAAPDVDANAVAHAGRAVCKRCLAEIAKARRAEAVLASAAGTRNGDGSTGRTATPRPALAEDDEKKLVRVAKKLAKDKGLNEAGVVTVGRKLLKLAQGKRSSRPPVPATLKRTDLPVIASALGLPETLLGRARETAAAQPEKKKASPRAKAQTSRTRSRARGGKPESNVKTK